MVERFAGLSGKNTLYENNTDGNRGDPFDQKYPDRSESEIDFSVVGNFFYGIGVGQFPGDDGLAVFGFMNALFSVKTPDPANENTQENAAER